MKAAALASIAAALAGLAACGTENGNGERSSRLVDFSRKPPYVNSLERDPRSGEFLLTTNRGFFRIDPRTDRVHRVRGSLSADGATSPVGTFLEVKVEPPGQLVGSGHPDRRTLPQYLGFLRSSDDGRTWRSVARLGDADLHKIVLRHDRIYAWDAVLSALVVSTDGGREFAEHFTPRGLIIDFEVDPEDPRRIVAATDDQLFRSQDEGEGWRPILQREGVRLAWPAADRLYRADKDGTINVSVDGGDSWDARARVDGEPYKIEAVSGEELYIALSDGTILHTTDGGAGFEAVFKP
jgi:photosystem II stability/assembly factor-like uncharacterized protein